jgi:hypothetical protein
VPFPRRFRLLCISEPSFGQCLRTELLLSLNRAGLKRLLCRSIVLRSMTRWVAGALI